MGFENFNFSNFWFILHYKFPGNLCSSNTSFLYQLWEAESNFKFVQSFFIHPVYAVSCSTLIENINKNVCRYVNLHLKWALTDTFNSRVTYNLYMCLLCWTIVHFLRQKNTHQVDLKRDNIVQKISSRCPRFT